jgi:hypothetical protein
VAIFGLNYFFVLLVGLIFPLCVSVKGWHAFCELHAAVAALVTEML